jgi:putative SOS response-associated peptidase YedK
MLNSPPQLEPGYNVAPILMAAVVRNQRDNNSLDLLKWGLVPSWSKDLSFGSHLVNRFR